jgi:PAS domain S-box-containing protein
LFVYAFLATSVSYMYLVLEGFGIDTGLIGLRFFDWASVPIIIAVFIAANDFIFKLDNYNLISKLFLLFTILSFLIPFIPVNTLIISTYIRMFVAIEINLAALYGFIKSRSPSYLLFIFSMMSLSIGGMSFLINENVTGIFGNAIGMIFLGLIFFIPQKDQYGISSYFSIKEELKDTKKALDESQSRYLRIFNAAKDAFLIFDLDGKIVEANEKAFEMYGYSPKEFLTLSGKDIVHPDYAHLFHAFKESVVSTGEFQTESIDLKKDGTPFHVEIRGTDIDYKGKKHLLAIVRDISHRKKAEEQLKKSRRQLATLMSNLPGMAYQCSPDKKWTMTYVSKGCTNLTGYDAERLIGNKKISYADLIVPQDRDYVFRMINDALNNHESFEMTYRIKTSSGKQKWVWEQGVGVFSEDGSLIDLEGFITDITEWKKADEELQKLANFANDYVSLPLDINLYDDLAHKIRSLIGSGIIVVNRIENENTMYVDSVVGINPKKMALVNKLLGNQQIGKPIENVPLEVRELLSNGALEEVPNGLNGLFFNRLPKRVARSIEKMMHIKGLYSIGLRHENELFGNVVIVLTEETKINKNAIEAIVNQAAVVLDKQKAWNELQKAHKEIQAMNLHLEKKVQQRTRRIEQLLKQKDEFINQLGHDLKNPLGPLINLIPIIEKHTTNHKDKEILQVIQRNVGYMKNLVQKTLELARLNSPKTKLSKTSFSLSSVVKNLLSQNKYLFEKKQIRVQTNIPSDITIYADQLRIEELFHNLLNNAVKYSKEFGRIIISASKNETALTISIKDEGTGMTSDQIDHVFDEFYKADESRHDFESSGLGMAICKRIVEKHGGIIWVESPGLNEGSTFYFTLPFKESTSNNDTKQRKEEGNVHQEIDLLLQRN